MTETSALADLAVVTPEIALALGAMLLLMIGVFRDKAAPAVEGGRTGFAQGGGMDAGRLVSLLAALLLVVVAYVVAQGEGVQGAFGELGSTALFVDDAFSRYAKGLILISAAIMLVIGRDYLRRNEMTQFEYPVLIVFAAIGMCMMVSANDLMAVYMGVELQALSLYVIAAFRRDSVRSTEAGLKYFVLGALSSGLLLYGASLVYGYAGATQFDRIAAALAGGEGEPAPLGLLIGLAFFIAGLAFKISAAPFHMWTPDVYEGAPIPVTAFFATAPKIAAGALFARAMIEPFSAVGPDWSQIVAFLAIASIFLGAFAGIGQTNIKRLMAYSSIGHMGFALIGLAAAGAAAGDPDDLGAGGVRSMLVYLTVYLVMNVGVFAFILMMTRDGRNVASLEALNGLARTHPSRAAALAILMFSLAGIPPLWGFFAKYSVLFAAVDAGLAWLAVAGVVGSVISAYYYLRIVNRMYFSEPEEPLDADAPTEQRLALGVSAAAMLLAIAPAAFLNGFGVPEAATQAAAALVAN